MAAGSVGGRGALLELRSGEAPAQMLVLVPEGVLEDVPGVALRLLDALLVLRPLDADRTGLGELLTLGRLGALQGGRAVGGEDDLACRVR